MLRQSRITENRAVVGGETVVVIRRKLLPAGKGSKAFTKEANRVFRSIRYYG